MEGGAGDLLFRARDLVELGWTQHAPSRAADGHEVEPSDPAAVRWSLLGAIVAALQGDPANGTEIPLGQLAVALDALATVVDDDSLARWNDDRARTQTAVAAALDAAATVASAR